MNYGELLRRARREARLTQPQLAARVGVSHSSIDGWERGAWQPTPDHLQTLRDVLGTFDGVPAEPDPLVDAIGAMSEAVAGFVLADVAEAHR